MTGRHYSKRRWGRIRRVQLAREPYCRICHRMGRLNAGTPDEPLEVDHIISLAKGGTDADDNLQTLCKTHHAQKTAAERLGRKWKPKGCDVTGQPLDLDSPWYTG